MSKEATAAARLRREARRQGCHLRKVRYRNPEQPGPPGSYYLIDVAGGRGGTRGLTLQQISGFLGVQLSDA